jgi:hypothetical protein
MRLRHLEEKGEGLEARCFKPYKRTGGGFTCQIKSIEKRLKALEERSARMDHEIQRLQAVVEIQKVEDTR